MKTRLLLLFVLLAGAGCQKDAPDAGLPPATREGKNTFGCLVDGQPFGPKPPLGINSRRREPLEASTYRTHLLVSARGDGGVDIALHNALQPGTYPIGEMRTARFGRYAFGSDEYSTNVVHTGTVTLTRIDTVAKVVAGTFQFTAINHHTGQTVTLTGGRFDVRLQ